jgi:hypothetical protein
MHHVIKHIEEAVGVHNKEHMAWVWRETVVTVTGCMFGGRNITASQRKNNGGVCGHAASAVGHYIPHICEALMKS